MRLWYIAESISRSYWLIDGHVGMGKPFKAISLTEMAVEHYFVVAYFI